ncbi:MAG: beta-lactamase family protein [Maribacter sp.]|nr:beta-lactamase family protein [Maribacter sp.]
MKLIKRILIAIVLIIVGIAIFNYPKLTIISGFAAKNMASNRFIASRTVEAVNANDHNVPLIKLADVEVHENEVAATVYGLMQRKSVCSDGLGCILIDDDFDISAINYKPNRNTTDTGLAFPFGNNGTKDTLFDNVDYNQLEMAIDGAFTNAEVQKTRTVLVSYKNQIIGEKYTAGFTKDTPVLGWSMTKSVLATLYGILQYQGKIEMEYLPFKELELSGLPGKDPRDHIPLDDLLRMQSGMAWDEDYSSISDVTRMLFMARDMTKAQLKTDYTLNSPKIWNYSSGTSNLLSGILREQFKSHQDYLDFPYSALIDKIGMRSMLIETDMSGNFVGSSYGWANTRDWAKFGMLHLNKGKWNGEQLFSPEWIDYITRPTSQSNGTYGAHWWLNAEGKYPDVPKDLYSANGYQGQYVFIIPSKDLVIVRTGLAESPDFDVNKFISEVIKAIN